MTRAGDPRFLLTGASGLLGGYLLQELAARGADVVAWSGTQVGSFFGGPFQGVNLADRDEVVLALLASWREKAYAESEQSE